MKQTILSLCIAAAAISMAPAEVVVRIADVPTEVRRFSPAFVTVSVQNTGHDPVIVPATCMSESRYVVEVGASADSMSIYQPFTGTGSGQVTLLAPGGTWYFRVDVGVPLQEVGTHFVRAGLLSTGVCLYGAGDVDPAQLKPLDRRSYHQTTACWAGEAWSQTVQIDVVEPSGPDDAAALAYARSDEFPIPCCLDDRFHWRLWFGVEYLLKRFPKSHYTYAGAMYAGRHSSAILDEVDRLQPDHPLAPYLRLERALVLAEEGRRAELTSEAIARLKLPAPLEAYLRQELDKRDRAAKQSPPAK